MKKMTWKLFRKDKDDYKKNSCSNEKNNILKWLLRVIGKEKWLIVILVVIQAMLGVLSIGFAFILRYIINMAVAGRKEKFEISIALLTGILLLQIVFSAMNRWLNEYTQIVIENRFKQRLFSALLTGKYASVTAIHSGEWMNRLTSDTLIVAQGVAEIMPGVISMLVRLVGALTAILWLEPSFFYIMVLGGSIMILSTYGFRKILKRLHKDIQETNGILRVFLQERLESLLIVHTFAKEKQMLEQAEELMNIYKDVRLKRSNFSNFCNIGFAAAMKGAYLFGISFGGYRILTGSMSYGNLMAIIQLVGQMQNPFANITGFLPRYYAMLASAERLLEAEKFEIDNEELIPEKVIKDFYQVDFQKIHMENVCFTYQPPVRTPEDVPLMPVILRYIDITIQKGEYIAFIGPSGCGKSTVLKLLMCLYPLDSGVQVLETSKGKYPLTAAWRGLFDYVPQGNQLLSGTIREIIAFGDSEREKDEKGIYHALRIACAEEFVKNLDKGLDTLLGERGKGLSGGQMQRISIARAIYSGHPILILDEATSALDEKTAKKLLENLRQMTDKTVLMVTHRMDQVEFFDKVIVFAKEGIHQMDIREKKNTEVKSRYM